MAKRTGHRVKRATRCAVPGIVIAVAPRMRWSHDVYTTGIHACHWSGAEIAVSYRRGDKWSAPQEIWVGTPEALRDTLDSLALPGRQQWVIAPSVGDLFTLSGWWEYAESKGISFSAGNRDGRDVVRPGDNGAGVQCTQFAMFGGCEILTSRIDGVRWRYVSARNYWPEPESARASGCRVQGGMGQRIPGERGPGDGGSCTNARALLTRFRGLCRWWSRVAKAPLGCTASQCAWGILRSHDDCRALCTHDDADAHRIEREACHGGRASVWYVGAVGSSADGDRAERSSGDVEVRARVHGPLHSLDVASMYPSIMRDERFPVAKLHCLATVRPAQLVETAQGAGVIAEVRLRTDIAEYPLRRGDRTIYPVGEYWTTLAGPDIIAAARDGEIVACRNVIVYQMGRPFKGAMEQLLGERVDAIRRGDKDASAFAKLLANSLAGRCAMRQGGWSRESKLDCPGEWGERVSMSATSRTVTRYRYLCGACWRHDPDASVRGPHTSAFAYLTSYGRQWMRRIRDTARDLSVVSQDTDGLYLLPTGLDRLQRAGMVGDGQPGTLRLVGSADTARFYGPKHYRFGDDWILAGLQYSHIDAQYLTVTYSQQTPLFSSRLRARPEVVGRVVRNGPVPREIDCGSVDPDGWVRPYRIIPGRQT